MPAIKDKESSLPALFTFDRPFERMFEEFWKSPFSLGPRTDGFIPSLDAFEEKDAFIVKADLPGLTEKEIEVELDGNLLTIRGEKKVEEEKKERDYHRIERRYGSFLRQITLPESVDTAKPAAEVKNGVLTVRFAKRPEAVKKSVKVEVK
ncbi:MAG TPA: Hsp20/alpha crystallin family protein [Planctomycetota bacterium]|nr:Hsp20/alpha crystallin family protein [Planctomycetota bacterium]